ncbi:hypothetical protein ACWHAM_24845 [Paenibacillus terrae]
MVRLRSINPNAGNGTDWRQLFNNQLVTVKEQKTEGQQFGRS